MFEEMRKTCRARPLVARSNSIKHIERYVGDRVILLNQDLHSVLQLMGLYSIVLILCDGPSSEGPEDHRGE